MKRILYACLLSSASKEGVFLRKYRQFVQCHYTTLSEFPEFGEITKWPNIYKSSHHTLLELAEFGKMIEMTDFYKVLTLQKKKTTKNKI